MVRRAEEGVMLLVMGEEGSQVGHSAAAEVLGEEVGLARLSRGEGEGSLSVAVAGRQAWRVARVMREDGRGGQL